MLILLTNEKGFGCLLPTIGKLWRQRFGEKRRGLLFKGCIIWEGGRLLPQSPSFQKTQRKIGKPHHPLPDQSKASLQVPSLIKNTVLQELQVATESPSKQLRFQPHHWWASGPLLFRGAIGHVASRSSLGQSQPARL